MERVSIEPLWDTAYLPLGDKTQLKTIWPLQDMLRISLRGIKHFEEKAQAKSLYYSDLLLSLKMFYPPKGDA